MPVFPQAHIFTESRGYLSKTGILLAGKEAGRMFVGQVVISICYKGGIYSVNILEDQQCVGSGQVS